MPAAEDTSFARLVSLACHDLRTPLATAHGFARTLERLGGLESPRDRYVEMISAASEQLGEVIDLLALAARIESGRWEPELREADSLELTRQATARIRDRTASVDGTGAAVRVEPDVAALALFGLAWCALRHGGVDAVDLRVSGGEIAISPITATAARVVVGEDMRDLGAAVGVRVVAALGGSTDLDGDVLRVRLPTAS